jgi:cytochrome b6-f complex iron-sulfur subunit
MGAERIDRRHVLAVGVIGGAGLVAAACGSSDDGSSATTAPTSGSAEPSDGPTSSPSVGGGSSDPIVAVSDVPVGGAVSAEGVDGDPILVAQPESGTIVAFSAICTHQGCTVAPGDGELDCPCHGSVYDLATGEVRNGPAPRPLPEVNVRVVDGEVVPG